MTCALMPDSDGATFNGQQNVFTDAQVAKYKPGTAVFLCELPCWSVSLLLLLKAVFVSEYAREGRCSLCDFNLSRRFLMNPQATR
jgi:hypothetical protein